MGIVSKIKRNQPIYDVSTFPLRNISCGSNRKPRNGNTWILCESVVGVILDGRYSMVLHNKAMAYYCYNISIRPLLFLFSHLQRIDLFASFLFLDYHTLTHRNIIDSLSPHCFIHIAEVLELRQRYVRQRPPKKILIIGERLVHVFLLVMPRIYWVAVDMIYCRFLAVSLDMNWRALDGPLHCVTVLCPAQDVAIWACAALILSSHKSGDVPC